jgi:hypothetical protein
MDLPADKEQAAMIDSFTVQQCEHVTLRSFEGVATAFEVELSGVEHATNIPRRVAAATTQADFEARIRPQGRSRFMRFLKNEHSARMSQVAAKSKIRSYIIGNPLIARTTITYDPGVGLNVPISVVIYQTASGEARLAYDQPSSLVSRLNNDEVSAASVNLDAKLRALADLASGVPA